jgi:hypothetical protein
MCTHRAGLGSRAALTTAAADGRREQLPDPRSLPPLLSQDAFVKWDENCDGEISDKEFRNARECRD